MNFYLALVASVALFTAFVNLGYYIINEETIIVTTFVAFIFLVYDTVNQVLQNMLDDRASKISQEIESFFKVREEYLSVVISYYEKQLNQSKNLKILTDHTIYLIKKAFTVQEIRLSNLLINEQRDKIYTVIQKEQVLQKYVQSTSGRLFSEAILELFQYGFYRGNSYRKQIALNESIERIQNLSQLNITNKSIDFRLVAALSVIFNLSVPSMVGLLMEGE